MDRQHHLGVGYKYRTGPQTMVNFNKIARYPVYMLIVGIPCFNSFRCYMEVPRKTGLGV